MIMNFKKSPSVNSYIKHNLTEDKNPETIREVGDMNTDLIRSRFSNIFKRGLVEYVKPTTRRMKKRFKLHRGHDRRNQWNKLDPNANPAIKNDSDTKDLMFLNNSENEEEPEHENEDQIDEEINQ
jgi:hypothetical protein